MQSRNDQPNINNFNFAVSSVFNNIQVGIANIVPIFPNAFLLLDTEFFFLLDGTNLLLLGT
jgi:predicted PurR-regulated permease PerM